MIKALIFDWGDTVMRDFPEKEGPMYLWDRVGWIPNAELALQQLYNKYIIVIATNAGQSDTQAMIRALERVGAERYFRYFFSSKDLGYEKPDVRFFETIANKIGVKPEHCAMIGNLYEKDITGAKQCGMFTVLFNEKQTEGDYPLADKVICGMEELEGIVTSY